jgi:SufS family cysteine desulfurase
MNMHNEKDKSHMPGQKEQSPADTGKSKMQAPDFIGKIANELYADMLKIFQEDKKAMGKAMDKAVDKAAAKAKEADKYKDKYKAMKKAVGKAAGKVKEKAMDKSMNKGMEQPGERPTEKPTEKPGEKASEKDKEKANVKDRGKDKYSLYSTQGTLAGGIEIGKLFDDTEPQKTSSSPIISDSQRFYFLPDPAPKVEKQVPADTFDVHGVRKDFPALHQKVHGKHLIWLDNAATTQKPQSVIDTITHFYERDNSNIHRGAHELATRATDHYEGAREKVRKFIGAKETREIIFVRGTTEAINLVAQSYGRKFIQKGDEIVVTEMEHHANIVPWQMLCEVTGAVLRMAPINDIGEIEMDKYAALLNSKTRIVGLTHVSNVLGTVLPVETMIQMAHAVGARVVLDGAQSIPHMPVNVRAMDCDFFAFSGHKLFGPTGIGILYGKSELLEEMPPWEGGGNMVKTVSFDKTTYSELPQKFEAGTHNIAGAAGLGATIDYLNRIDVQAAQQHKQGVLNYAIDALSSIPGLRLIGTAPGKVSVISFVLDNIPNEKVGQLLDREGIAVRAGHHCALPVLAHYGLTSSVRPSLAFYNTYEEMDALVAAIQKIQSRTH